MKIIGILQARDNSSRLPRKSTQDVNGKVILQHILDRMNAVGSLDGVVVSTSVNSPEIIGYCKLNGVPYHAGSEEDLLSRHLDAAVEYKADAILRVTGDELFIDPAIIEAEVKHFRSVKLDALINWEHGFRRVSEGLDLAIVRTEYMGMLNDDPICPREDWLSYAERDGYRACIGGSSLKEKRGEDLHLSIDTFDDLERARRMMAYIGNDDYRYEKTLEAYEATK